jgi:hypothetical protein
MLCLNAWMLARLLFLLSYCQGQSDLADVGRHQLRGANCRAHAVRLPPCVYAVLADTLPII